MSHRCLSHLLVLLLLLLALPAGMSAQRPRFGLALGYSLVGGGDSRTATDLGGYRVTGAGGAGLHLRGMFDVPVTATPISLRAELFYNHLSSGPNTYALTSEGDARSALSDRTFGLTGSIVAETSRSARLAPYFSLGAGVFTSSLGTNSDPQSGTVSDHSQGMGLGLVAGTGLRLRLGGPTLLLDYRYYQALHHTRGSSFMPLSLGVMF